ncbi:MAG TPA: hypothetical protein PKI94_07090 [Candidatus Gastranaerophilaceae bacterium]|nr:hypothetical protein [Candidatus Gastranaerophilaceae bacterium]
MKYAKFAITLAVLATCTGMAFADGAFTPLNFDDAGYSAPKTTSNPIKSLLNKEGANALQTVPGEVPIGNENIQNAILELDNAQVGIRNDLLNYKSKYADVDAQYKLIKNERSMLYKQVRSIEKRIKDIDRAKDKIRKNML